MEKQKKIAYLDTISGISGDMLLGALVDLGLPFEKLKEAIDSFSVHGLTLERKEVKKNGFRACKIDVNVPHEHAHRHLSVILDMIDGSALTPGAKKIAQRIFKKIAEAEAKVHGTTPDEVHFHEVGAADSIADIAGTAVGFDYFQFDQILSSPVPTGTGKVKIAHGICSIPAPATAELLKGIPLAQCDIPFELTTPTGAGVLAVLADGFGPIPNMKIEEIGIGAGNRDLETQPNILRILKGTLDGNSEPAQEKEEELWMVETNIDDASGELIGFVQEKIQGLKPRDIFTTSIQMKKQRPGTKISVLVDKSQVAGVEDILFSETPTLGIRRYPVFRTVLERQSVDVATPWGQVSGKIAGRQGKFFKFKPEYEDLKRIACQNNIPIQQVNREAIAAFHSQQKKRS